MVAVVFALLFLFSFMPHIAYTPMGRLFFWLGQGGLLTSLIYLLSMRKRRFK